VAASLNDMVMETHRRRHLAYLMADQGALVGNPEAVPNLPKQHLSRSGFLCRLWHILLTLLAVFHGCVCNVPAWVWKTDYSVRRQEESIRLDRTIRKEGANDSRGSICTDDVCCCRRSNNNSNNNNNNNMRASTIS